MFREIRRKRNEININDAKYLLNKERRGILAVNGDDGYPYAVPVNYLYSEVDNAIYFHGSKVGHKIDSIKKSDKVCFTVFGNEQIKEEAWAPYMQSVVIFGRCILIDNQDVAISILKKFASKYYPNMELIEEEVSKSANAVQMFKINIEHISAKQIKEK